ncbi:hypothetical protein ONE63_000450 [Megalurothrips usitatus]|uniref:F-box domain-containing protein n=1 Tax=Megalurothrips usitatus TaxID=439358 RepID=A0AAV7Y5L3_9NEOP|nr:hypothetical protein ONE63_000450 [Megalurothrips usitatus]
MPSAAVNMGEPSHEEFLSKDLMAKLKICNKNEETSFLSSMKSDLNYDLIESHNCPYGSAAQTIASLLTPKMSACEAAKRCDELEAELKAEKQMVAKLKDQLKHSEKMLSELRSAHSKCPSALKFEDLPEELMVTIFSYLPTDTLLFTVSKVCQQWKRLSEDTVLWSQVSILRDFNRLIRTLHHAPCLRTVCIPSEFLTVHDDEEDEYVQILTKTKCRIRSLTVPDFQPIMLRMLRNQLGSLRHVQINSWWDNMRLAYRGEVWQTLATLDLQSLTLHEFDGGNSYFHTAFRPAAGQFAGVRHLDLYCKVVPGGLLADLIAACRGSLVTVALPPKSKGEVVALLAECGKLREANVPFLEEVCALERNEQLELLELNAEWLSKAKVQSVIPEVIRFLHMRSTVERLRTLFFQGMPVSCRELLRAVYKVRGLRYVRIHNFGEPEAAHMVPKVLDELRHLERFCIAALPSPAVLDEVPAAACPGLRELTLIGACHDDEHGCRVPAVMRLIRDRPGLHVFLDLGLGVKDHLEGKYPQCLRYHRHVCPDESLWHRFYPVMTSHKPDRCAWCRFNVEDYATVVNMEGRLDVEAVPPLEDDL